VSDRAENSRDGRCDLQLVCFPYSGGSAVIYRRWARRFPVTTEVIAVDPPGRDLFDHEPGAVNRLAEQMADDLASSLSTPCVLFGHSMGALLAYLVARRLSAAGVDPSLLVVSGFGSPQEMHARKAAAGLLQGNPRTLLSSLGGLPKWALSDDRFVAGVAEAITRDLELCKTYVHVPGPPLRTPIVALGGMDDDFVDVASLRRWAQHTTAGFRVSVFPGGHFFIREHEPAIIGELGVLFSALVSHSTGDQFTIGMERADKCGHDCR
jgi:surfactin synthase thioesterase subunit